MPQLENGYTRIANELIEQFARIRISGEAMQILWVIIRKTYGYKKKSDRIAILQFSQATGIKRSNVCRAINKLTEMGVISVIKKENDLASEYSIVKASDKWKPLSKKRTLSKKITNVINNDNETLSKKRPSKEKEKKKESGAKKAKPEIPAKKKKPNAWGIWIDVNREFKRSDPAPISKDTKASKTIFKALGNDVEKYTDVLRQFLNDGEDFLKNNGHGLSFLQSKINKYLNKAVVKKPIENDPYENDPPPWSWFYEMAMDAAGFVDQELADKAGFKSLTKEEWEVERELLGIEKAT